MIHHFLQTFIFCRCGEGCVRWRPDRVVSFGWTSVVASESTELTPARTCRTCSTRCSQTATPSSSAAASRPRRPPSLRRLFHLPRNRSTSCVQGCVSPLPADLQPPRAFPSAVGGRILQPGNPHQSHVVQGRPEGDWRRTRKRDLQRVLDLRLLQKHVAHKVLTKDHAGDEVSTLPFRELN